MSKKDSAQLSLPDIEQMALFQESLPEETVKRGLEDILKNGDVNELGKFIKFTPYKTLRIELTHCGYDLSDITDKVSLTRVFWPELIQAVRHRR